MSKFNSLQGKTATTVIKQTCEGMEKSCYDIMARGIKQPIGCVKKCLTELRVQSLLRQSAAEASGRCRWC